jgi:hypothetical protein
MSNRPMKSRADIPQSVRVVEEVLSAAGEDKNLLGALVSDPAQAFAASGYPLRQQDFAAFNQFFQVQARPIITQLANEGDLMAVADVRCTLCIIGSYSVATLITGVGAGALTLLTAGSAPVLALASFAAVTPLVSLAFIIGLGATVVAGVAAVAQAICQWAGVC